MLVVAPVPALQSQLVGLTVRTPMDSCGSNGGPVCDSGRTALIHVLLLCPAVGTPKTGTEEPSSKPKVELEAESEFESESEVGRELVVEFDASVPLTEGLQSPRAV